MERLPQTGLLVVRSGRHPHTICLSLGLVAISLYGLIFTTPSVSLDAGLDIEQRIGFSVASVAGAALTLAGVYWPNLLPGLLLERMGQILLAVGAIVYVVVLCTVSTFDRSGLVTTLGCAIAAGSIWRAIQLTRRDLPIVRTWLAKEAA